MEQQQHRDARLPGYSGDAPLDDLAVRLTQLARSLQDERNVQDTLNAIVVAAAATVPGAQDAGLMVVERRRHVETRAATDELVRQVDQAQYDTGQGPCLDTVRGEQTVRIDDLRTDERWPAFGRRGSELGVRSMLSFQLSVESDRLGALNLYSREPNAFDAGSEHVGMLFATHASVAMFGAQRQEQLNRAVEVRDLIGQAKGILMERYKITDDRAFALLVRASQTSNRKLIDVARYLAETGELGSPGRGRAAQ